MVMHKVPVDLGERSYNILIGEQLLQQVGTLAQSEGIGTGSACLVITDEHVAAAGHLATVMESLQAAGYRANQAVVKAGEATKSFAEAERLYNLAFECGLDRKSAIFALGGGVVGDLAGFIAATYMRGIKFVQLPTTILAHDSSVGGKVAINHPRSKNLIGAFYQPELVVYDIVALTTLPEREIRSGLAEVIKHGAIWDAEFFAWLESGIEKAVGLEPGYLAELLARSCAVKASIVSKDEKEQNLRAILNFGHTLAHALESASGYGVLTHGEAVAIGMVFAARLSEQLGHINDADVSRIRSLLQRTGLPVELPAGCNTEELISLMKQDKKTAAGKLTFVLLNSLGAAAAAAQIEEEAVRLQLQLYGR